MTSRRSERGLDWFAFFLADVQTGWGPFVAAYLTSMAWTQFDIGRVLTIGTLTGLALQVPAGALVDRVPRKRLLAAVAVVAVSGSALVLTLWPVFRAVVVAKVLHAIGSCLVGPALAAISLGLVGHARLSVRLGRNARYLSLGNAIAAAAMGVAGYLYTNRAIFVLTAALGVPTLLALTQIRASEIDPALARGGIAPARAGDRRIERWRHASAAVLRSRALLVFAAAVLLFQLANAALLPIIAGALTALQAERATVILAVGILTPQLWWRPSRPGWDVRPRRAGVARSWPCASSRCRSGPRSSRGPPHRAWSWLPRCSTACRRRRWACWCRWSSRTRRAGPGISTWPRARWAQRSASARRSAPQARGTWRTWRAAGWSSRCSRRWRPPACWSWWD
jgi:MFS family permease